MKKIVSLFLCFMMVAFSAITVFGAEEEETIPIPERPEELYIIDEPGVLTKRTYNSIIKKGNSLFAITGAQVVMIIVDEDNEVELGLLAQQMLERWEIGAHDRDNGFVIAIDFKRGRASYAVGEGLAQVLSKSEVTKIITDHTLGDNYAAGKYSAVASSLYSDIQAAIYTYYGTSILEWDGETYHYKAGYEVEETDNTMLFAGSGAAIVVLFFVLVIVSSIRHNKRMDEIAGLEKEGGYSDEEEDSAVAEAEEASEVSAEPESDYAEDYITDEGEYNTDEGQYNTESEWDYN